jgi:hypothetical protein
MSLFGRFRRFGGVPEFSVRCVVAVSQGLIVVSSVGKNGGGERDCQESVDLHDCIKRVANERLMLASSSEKKSERIV